MLEFSQYFYSLEGESIEQFHADCAAVNGQTFDTLEELWKALPSKCDNFEWVYYVMIGASASVKESYEVIWDADGRISGFTTPEKATIEPARLACSISDPDENGMVTIKEYDGDTVVSETVIRQQTTEESQKQFADWATDFYTKKREEEEKMHNTNYPDIKSIWQSKSDTLPAPPALIEVDMETKTLVDPQTIRQEAVALIKCIMGLEPYQKECDAFRNGEFGQESFHILVDSYVDTYAGKASESAKDMARMALRVIF